MLRILGDWNQPRPSSLAPMIHGAYAKVPFAIKNVPSGSTVDSVRWSAKADIDDETALLSKIVTPSLVNSIGVIEQAAGGADVTGYLIFTISEITDALDVLLVQDTWVVLSDNNRRQVAMGDISFVKPVTLFGAGGAVGSPLPPISTSTSLVIRAADISDLETATLPSGHTYTLGSDAAQIDSNNPYLDSAATPPQFVMFGDDYAMVNGGGGPGQAGTLHTILQSVVGLSAVWAGTLEAGDLSGNKVLCACDRDAGTALWVVLTGGQLEFKRFHKNGAITGADVVRANAPTTAGRHRLGFVYLAGQLSADASFRLYIDGVSVGFSYSAEGAGSYADLIDTDATSKLHLGYSPTVFSMIPPKRHMLAVVAPASWSAGDVTQVNNWITDQGF